jgi:hypothetical protein
MQKFFVALAIFLLPSIAFAAGFAKQSIFLSTDSPTEGDSVFVYVVLYNDTNQPFTGLLKIYDTDGTIGTSSVALLAGKAETAAIPWQPAAGTYVLNATLLTPDGATTIESESASFVVAPQPEPATTQASTGNGGAGMSIQSSTPLEQFIASFSPAVASGTAPVFSAIDSGRDATGQVLGAATTWAEQQAVPKETSGQKLTSTTTPAVASVVQATVTSSATALAWLLMALHYGVANIGIFYPVIVLLFFFFMWRLWRRMRRPRYR